MLRLLWPRAGLWRKPVLPSLRAACQNNLKVPDTQYVVPFHCRTPLLLHSPGFLPARGAKAPVNQLAAPARGSRRRLGITIAAAAAATPASWRARRQPRCWSSCSAPREPGISMWHARTRASCPRSWSLSSEDGDKKRLSGVSAGQACIRPAQQPGLLCSNTGLQVLPQSNRMHLCSAGLLSSCGCRRRLHVLLSAAAADPWAHPLRCSLLCRYDPRVQRHVLFTETKLK